MRLALSLCYFLLGSVATVCVSGQEEGSEIFPYEYGLRDLDNGLRVLVINTGFPNVVSLHIPVQVGPRYETEPGLTGFAHFYEHMMFRGSANFTAEEFSTFYTRIGADFNAKTSTDYTSYYAELPSQEYLEQALILEADRFRFPNFTEHDFKIEASAVLGEYQQKFLNKPGNNARRVLIDIAYTTHPYKHSTLGLIEDIRDMPNQFNYSKVFFERFYRPENTMVIVAGDLDVNETSALVEKHWGDWDRGERYVANVPEEPLGTGHVYHHVEWNSTTLPFVIVAFHGPAFSDKENDFAAIDVAMYYAFGPTSEIRKKLVNTERKARSVKGSVSERLDPYLVQAYAYVYDAEDVPYVQNEIMKTFASLRAELVQAKMLARTASYLSYSSANKMDSSSSIAESQERYMALTRDPETWNRVYKMYGEVSSNDVFDKANQYFTDNRLVVVSLAGPGVPNPEANLTFSIDAMVRAMSLDPPDIATVLLPSDSPLVDFNIVFNVGAMDDPVGKEGLASLTGKMVSGGGSTVMSYDQIKEALYPMAANLYSEADKEMTSFKVRTHLANLEDVYSVISAQLLHPAFDEADFERMKTNFVMAIEQNLRRNSKKLGAMVLSDLMYVDHPYGHFTDGSVSALKNITLDDVRQFYEAQYTLENVVLGLAGGFSDDFVNEVKMDLARDLPAGNTTERHFPQPMTLSEAQVTIIRQNGGGETSVMFGCPIAVTPSHSDYAALWLATSYFGKGMSSRLFQSIREIRGLNYQASASYEAGGFNNGRQSEAWRVYLSETDTVERGHFAVRCAMYELDKMIQNGISEQDFNITRQSLLLSVNLLTATQSAELGYTMDNFYYGITDDYTTYMKDALNALTVDKVNNAIRSHVSTEGLSFVFITSDSEDLKDRLVNEETSLITYPSEPSEEVLEEDKIIQDYRLGITSDNIDIIAADSIGEGESADVPINLAPEPDMEITTNEVIGDIVDSAEDLVSIPLALESNTSAVENLNTTETNEEIMVEDIAESAMAAVASNAGYIIGFDYHLRVVPCFMCLVGFFL